MGIFVTIITVAFFAHCRTCSLISMHWRSCMHGRKLGTLGFAVQSLLSAEESVSLYILMIPLTFQFNNDDITVLKQSANRARILAHICYAPHARFPHFLEAFPSSF